MKIFIFKINLAHAKKIKRIIEVEENISLYKLAQAIIKAYDFDFDHPFGFYSSLTPYYYDSEEIYELFTDLKELESSAGAGSVKKTKIKEVWKETGDKMQFLFDYGDNWQFIVELAKFGQVEQGKKYPCVLKSVGKAPIQYPLEEDDDEYEED